MRESRAMVPALLERPYHAHGRSQVPVRNHRGDAGHRQHGEDGGSDAEDHAEEDVELPQVGHDARQHHACDEQDAAKQQQPAYPVPVAEQSDVWANQPQHYPLQAESEADLAVAPPETRVGIAQVRHQRGGGEPDGRGDEPHSRSDSHDDPGVMDAPSVNASNALLKTGGCAQPGAYPTAETDHVSPVQVRRSIHVGFHRRRNRSKAMALRYITDSKNQVKDTYEANCGPVSQRCFRAPTGVAHSPR